ncbi:MAG: hypothetical protein NC923_00090 [Candidatus Omnitrophica bacterium]|nr:hypothetical protein [Candidatus Omnitrophota bacterium]
MKRTGLRFGGQKGAALIIASLAITVLLVWSGAFVTVSMNQNLAADIFKRQTQAFNIAESGLDHTITWLRVQPSPPVGNYTNPWGGVQNLGGGTYSVVITDLGLVGGSGSTRRYKITSTGSYGGINRIMTNYVQVDNYARYLWFTDKEVFGGTNVWFWTQDRINGPTYTNGHFNIAGNPVFESEARSVDDYIRFYNNGNNINLQQTANPPYDLPDFQQGVDFGAEPITMPSQALNLRSAASNGGLYLQGNSTVVLNNDGTMNVTNAKKGWVNRNMPLPANGALFVACDGSRCRNGGSLTIFGTLNGQLTVGSERDTIITNNLLYADDPRINPHSDDMLGIISEGDVVIDDHAPYNLEIDGCIMAMDTSFMLENYWVGPPKGTLTVYGGIIQDERGPVGTFNGKTGQKVSGYSKNYSYDSRFLGSPPLFMPTTEDYVTLSWEED